MYGSGRKAALDVICILAVSMVFVVIASVFSLIDMPSYAADGGKVIQLVNDGAAAGIQGKQKSNIYFGNYPQSKDEFGRYKVEPIKWRVLQNTEGKVFLMADKLLDSQFFDDARHRTWEGSNVRAWLNGYGEHSGVGFIDKALSSDEQESVAITVVKTPINPEYGTSGGEDTSDKIFLMSYPEVIDPDFGFNSDRTIEDDARKGVFTDYSASLPAANSECIWTLRTKGQDSGLQVTVRGNGAITSLGGIGIGTGDVSSSYPKPIRPALKVDIGSVLFASAAANGKQSGDLGPDAMKAASTFNGKDWKFTIKDADRGFRISQTETKCRINDTLTLNYTGAVTGTNEYISAMISDQAGEVLFYGRVAKPESASGTVDITVPESISTGTYDLKVFNEQYNGDMKTDYASEMSNVSLTVDDPVIPYVNDAGRKQPPKVCKPVREDTEKTQTLSSGWYVVLEDVSTKRIVVSGNVDLILCDGATLDAIQGITINANSSLTIWAQSTGNDKGVLDASLKNYSITASDSIAGIGFDSEGTGKLTINGGNIIAKNSGCAAAIGGNKGKPGGKVIINGGKVIAQATIGFVPYINNQAIGHGAGIPAASAGTIELGKVKVSTDGGSSYLDSSDRAATCRLPSTEILIERCSDHLFEDDVCKYCGAGRPVRIDDESSDLKVTLEPLVFNGKEQTQKVTKITLNGTDITEFCDISDNSQKDAGDYELTIKADPECGYEGTVKEKFTISKIVPNFTVTADEVNDDLNVSAAVLKRSSEEIPGTLALTETTLLYGTNTYNWTFTPEDKKNYETVSGTVQIKVLGHKWKFDGFEWTGNEKDGYTKVIAKYVCENDAGHNGTVSNVTLQDKETKPTCTEGGKTLYTAAVSKTDSFDGEKHTESKDAKLTDKLGHKWDDGVISKEPTASEYGEKTFTCTFCKAIRTETIPMLKPDEKEAEEAKEDKDLPVIDIEKAHTVGNFKKRQMKIEFPADKRVDNYRVQYRLAGKKNWTSDWSAGTGTYVVKNLKKYSLCEFRIAGYVQLDDGTWIRSKWSKISYRYVSSVPLKTVKAAKKKITVTYKKDSRSDGYKIQYSLKKDMSGRKTVTVKGKARTKYTIEGMKKWKTYFIKVRPIKKKYGKTYIGILSGTKKVKVK